MDFAHPIWGPATTFALALVVLWGVDRFMKWGSDFAYNSMNGCGFTLLLYLCLTSAATGFVFDVLWLGGIKILINLPLFVLALSGIWLGIVMTNPAVWFQGQTLVYNSRLFALVLALIGTYSDAEFIRRSSYGVCLIVVLLLKRSRWA